MNEIGELHRLRARLEQREQLGVVLEGLLESLADGIVALDFRGDVTHVSDTLLEPSLAVGAETSLPREILARLRAEADSVGTQPRRFELRWNREETGGRIYEVVAASAHLGAEAANAHLGTEAPVRGEVAHLGAEASVRGEDPAARAPGAGNRSDGDPAGGPLLTLFAFHDRTQLHDLRRELERTRDLAALGRMAATVAHELRNPLGVIQGFANLHERDLRAAGADTRAVERILQGVEGANRIVGDLLEYARPAAPQEQAIAVEALLAESVAMLEISPRYRREVSVDVQVDGHLPVVRGDRRLLLQALANLYHNALDAIEGAGAISVRARTTGGVAGKDRLRIVVRDSGCGLAADEVQRIFEPFYTTKPGGTGLGMAIVRRTVESHGGEVHVVSAQGRGTSVVLDLPAVPGPEPEAITPPPRERARSRKMVKEGEREDWLADAEREAA